MERAESDGRCCWNCSREVRRGSGLKEVGLSVAVTQKAALRLYASLGFKGYGRERRALRVGRRCIDEELMALRLDP